jgi:hypothetical protein
MSASQKPVGPGGNAGEDAEDLEPVEELEGADGDDFVGEAELDSIIEVATIAEIMEALRESSDIISDEGGLFQINTTAYEDSERGEDEGIRDLVESVTGETPGGQGESDDAGQQGIEDLLGVGSFDLFDDDFLNDEVRSDVSGQAEASDASERRAIVLTRNGFDYDIFLRRYRSNESGIIKSLVEYTRLWGARVGCILAEEAQGLTPVHYLGFDDRCMSSFVLGTETGPFYDLFQQRRLVLVKRSLAEVEYFGRLCPANQLSTVERALFLPAVFKRKPAYLLLGVRPSVTDLKSYVISAVSAQGGR